MMDTLPIEWAKALKEAGFPHARLQSLSGEPEEWDSYFFPLLEELIEACPKIIEGYEFTLSPDTYNRTERWAARYLNHHETGYDILTLTDFLRFRKGQRGLPTADDYIQGFGETPNEAVARLWLTLPPEARIA